MSNMVVAELSVNLIKLYYCHVTRLCLGLIMCVYVCVSVCVHARVRLCVNVYVHV